MITLIEAILTFIMFPLLIILCYMADVGIGCFARARESDAEKVKQHMALEDPNPDMSLKVGPGGPQSGHVAEGRLWKGGPIRT